jgi:hypothetical protein
MHVACPEVQLLEQVGEHAAFGALPPQTGFGEAHGVVEATWRQPFESVMHVASVDLSWHTVPASVHGLALHVHDAPASPEVHVWFGPQAAVVTQ